MASGVVATFAFPPAQLRFVAFAALVPFLLSLRQATVRDGAVAGAAFGLAFMGVLIGWISIVGWIAWAALVFAQMLFYAGFGALAALLGRAGPVARVLGWPLVFTGFELARSRFPLGGFEWGVLGSSQEAVSTLTPLARAGGVFAISIALVAINALLSEAIAARRKRNAVLAVALAAAGAIAPAMMPLGAVANSGTIDVAMVQGNVPRGYFAGLRRGRVGPEDEIIIANHLRLTDTLAANPPELVIWPENALDRDPFTDQEARRAIVDATAATGAPLLVGAIIDGPRPGTFFNANLLFDEGGRLLGRYDKMKLVPFGEYVPWQWTRSVVPALSAIGSDGIPGDEPVVLNANGTQIGAVICFESSRAELVRRFVERGAEMIVVSTNNATFERTPLARQHLALSRMRAVETGRPVLHAAISGISAIIQPDGSIVQQAGLFRPAILRQRIQTTSGLTPYVAYGATIELAYGIGAAVAAIVALLFIRRRPSTVAEDDEPDFWLAPVTAAHDEPHPLLAHVDDADHSSAPPPGPSPAPSSSPASVATKDPAPPARDEPEAEAEPPRGDRGAETAQ